MCTKPAREVESLSFKKGNLMNRINPFKLVDELIRQNYRIPHYISRTKVGEPGESFMTITDASTINLGELLSFIKQYAFNIQNERDELRKDLYTVTSNGSVRYFSDSYYSNRAAFDESNKIYNKWFNGPVNFQDGEYFDCPFFQKATEDFSYCENRYNHKGVCSPSLCPRNKEKK